MTAGAACPVCGTALELLESHSYADPVNVAVDKVIFDGEARWVEFEEELVYRILRCPRCECDLRQIELDGEVEPPMMDPTCEPA